MKTIEARRIAAAASAAAVAYTVSGGREKAIQSENHWTESAFSSVKETNIIKAY